MRLAPWPASPAAGLPSQADTLPPTQKRRLFACIGTPRLPLYQMNQGMLDTYMREHALPDGVAHHKARGAEDGEAGGGRGVAGRSEEVVLRACARVGFAAKALGNMAWGNMALGGVSERGQAPGKGGRCSCIMQTSASSLCCLLPPARPPARLPAPAPASNVAPPSKVKFRVGKNCSRVGASVRSASAGSDQHVRFGCSTAHRGGRSRRSVGRGPEQHGLSQYCAARAAVQCSVFAAKAPD